MIKKSLFVFLIVIVVLVGILHSLTPHLMGDEEAAQDYFGPLNLDYEESYYNIKGIQLHSVQTGDTSSSKMILFIHGTPGSWMDFKKYLSDSTLRSKFQMISIDRPGQGQSNYGQTMVSIEEQSTVLLELLKNYKSDSIVLMGYSYGGPIAALLASNAVLPVSKLMLLSPTIGPECEP